MMALVRTMIMVMLLMVPLAGTAGAADMVAGMPGAGYLVGPGDVLDISVWKNVDLTKMVTVLPDGKINFPLIGEVRAAGRTVSQLKKEIASRLISYVPDPSLSVSLHQVNSLMIYVIGKVNKPDRFVLNANVNVLQALAMAGGLNSFAKRDRIKVFRNQGGKAVIFEFDYDAVSTGKNLQQNIVLVRGDIIVVP